MAGKITVYLHLGFLPLYYLSFNKEKHELKGTGAECISSLPRSCVLEIVIAELNHPYCLNQIRSDQSLSHARLFETP